MCTAFIERMRYPEVYSTSRWWTTQNIPFTGVSHIILELVSSVCKDETLDTYWLHFHIADDQRDSNEYCIVSNSKLPPPPQNSKYITTCYKSLVKLLVELTKWKNIPYSTIITVFCIYKMAACTVGVKNEYSCKLKTPSPLVWLHPKQSDSSSTLLWEFHIL